MHGKRRSYGPGTVRIAPKWIFADEAIISSSLASIAIASHLPAARDPRTRFGIDVALTTMNDSVLRVGELLIPIVGVMKRDLLDGGYVQADETHVGVQTPDRKGKNHRG